MMHSVDLADQYARTSTDQLRVLVVGAGVAGVSVAQLLRRSGLHPVLIDRSVGDGSAGYMLALMPMVDGVLNDLDSWQSYREASQPLMHYGLDSHTGARLRLDPIAEVIGRFGDYRGIARGALLDVLAGDDGEVAYATSVTALTEGADGARVTLTGSAGEAVLGFDLVIIADGISSTTRDLVLGGRSVTGVDTHWGGWVVWVPPGDEQDLAEELWGAGFFLGLYPVRGRRGAFVGASEGATRVGPAAFAASVRRRLATISPSMEGVLTALAEDPDPYYWPLSDIRAPAWTTGHTVLLGDAAAGFLPTAGIGAGMAMESAWVLAQLLRDSTAEDLADLLQTYEHAQRRRVEAAQDNSRTLAKIMCRDSVALAAVRDVAMRFTSVKVALKPILRLLEHRPDPEAIRSARGRRSTSVSSRDR